MRTTTTAKALTGRVARAGKTAAVAGMALAVALAVAACTSLTSPNFNGGDLEELQTNPTRASIASAAQGLLIGSRAYIGPPNGYVSLLGILGRNSYNLDIADPRFVDEMLGGDLSAASPAFGGNIWGVPYANLRMADLVLQAVDAVPEPELSPAEREAARGFTKTMMALDFLHIVNTRDVNCDGTFGCPVEIAQQVGEPAPAVPRDQVFQHIVQLLQEARGHLQAGGDAFPFFLSSGFAGFNTPADFLAFNWALTARVEVYRGNFGEALTALENSFLDTSAPLDLGVYHAFGTGSGDTQNGLFVRGTGPDPNLRAHPSVVVDAELQGDGTPDDRMLRKTRDIQFRQQQGVGSDVGFDIYTRLDAPIPIIRNEELILLRAEANIGLDQLGPAETDINFIRQASGGLDPVSLTSPEQALDQLLYEKRYSLLFEGGHRWLDLRRYDRLDELPLDLPAHQINAAFPVPIDEQLARGG